MATMQMDVLLSYLEYKLRLQQEQQEAVELYRRYYDGVQDTDLTERLAEFLDLHGDVSPFRFNICKTIVTSIKGELKVLGFETDEPASSDGKRPQSEWIARFLVAANFSSIQDTVHRNLFRDGETFVLIDYDTNIKLPTLRPVKFLTTTDAGGDGNGMYAVYVNDDPEQALKMVVKEWYENYLDADGSPAVRQRRTVYYPERIERYVYTDKWMPFTDEKFPQFPIPWTRADGSPRGIPVVHFLGEDGKSELYDIIAMQDLVNKTLLDIVASSDLTAFRMFFTYGFFATTDGLEPRADGSNLMQFGPGRVNGTTKASGEAETQVIDGADITPMMNALKDFILMTAQLSSIPVNHFIMTGQVASSETLKDQEKPFIRKTAALRTLAGGKWKQVIKIARILHNDNTVEVAQRLDENIDVATIWQHANTETELQLKRSLGVPNQQLWGEIGYTAKEIALILAMPEVKLVFEKQLWDGAASALKYMSLETYLKRVGLPQTEIAAILATQPATNPDTQNSQDAQTI